MLTLEDRIDLGMHRWMIVPISETRPVELGLALCTGIVMQPRDSRDAPYLVAHSPAVPSYSYARFAEITFEDVLCAPLFLDTWGKQGLSFLEIFHKYQLELLSQEYDCGVADFAVYMCSGFRAGTISDLAFSRLFLALDTLYGAELGRTSLMRFYPREGRIDVCDLVERRSVRAHFRFGERYELQLRI